MTAAGPARHLTAAPDPVMVPRVHADRATYQEWVQHHCTSYAARWDRMKNYDRFVEQWTLLQDWFDAPFATRVVTRGVDVTVNVGYKHSRTKEYFKEGRALRARR